MKRLIFIGLVLFTTIVQARLTAQIDSSTIALGQTFRLILSTDNPHAGNIPNLTPLQSDFDVVGTERSSSYTITNGQTHSSSQWVISLIPKHSGVLIIPALTMGQEHTQATSITVTQEVNGSSASVKTDTDQGMLLTAKANDEQPYVNQQVLYTVKLYNSKQLINVNYKGPQIKDALMFPLGSSQSSQIYKNGRDYAVEEQTYAIFPQKSGQLTIDPPQFNALVYDFRPQQVRIQAKPTTLKVKAAPINSKTWLPAKNVTLSEQYDRNTTSLTQGSTLIRTVTLQAVGMPAQLLPELTFASNTNFRAYPDKANDKNSMRQRDLVGSKTVNVTYLLNQPGKVIIPAVRVAWFNVLTKKEEQTVLPETTIDVVASNAPNITTDHQGVAQSTAAATPLVTTSSSATPLVATNQNRLPWILALSFGVIWLVTLLLWWLTRAKSVNVQKQTKQPSLTSLQQACANNEPNAAKAALLDWARARWPQERLLSLLDLKQVIDEPSLVAEIEKLSNALYHPTKPIWSGELLWCCIVAYQKSIKGRVQQNKDKTPLPPINPD